MSEVKIFDSYKATFTKKMLEAYEPIFEELKKLDSTAVQIHFKPYTSNIVKPISEKQYYPLHCNLWLAGYPVDAPSCCDVCHSGLLNHSWGFRRSLIKDHENTSYVVCCQVMKICLKGVGK